MVHSLSRVCCAVQGNYGFIDFDDFKTAKDAMLHMHGEKFSGARLTVDVSSEPFLMLPGKQDAAFRVHIAASQKVMLNLSAGALFVSFPLQGQGEFSHSGHVHQLACLCWNYTAESVTIFKSL